MADKKLSTVLAVGSHPVDLEDGRSLAVGETAEGTDITTPYHRALIDDGALVIIEGTTPPAESAGQLAAAAAKEGTA